jgi:hypothetical protein
MFASARDTWVIVHSTPGVPLPMVAGAMHQQATASHPTHQKPAFTSNWKTSIDNGAPVTSLAAIQRPVNQTFLSNM